ncbi:MAG: hypothetical protein ACRDFQ_03340, partial [Anaerolineales bacterium]
MSDARFERVTRVVWGLLLLTVPVTTFRFLPTPFGRSVVAPLSLLPLALLFPLLALDFLRSRRLPLP